MLKKIDNLLSYSFYLLFFLVPLAVYPNTSELFEFNKMILTYAFTTFIVSFWIIKIILSGKIIFRKTSIDLFLIIFFISQVLTTIFSVDQRSSLLGYYSRFHGGLISSLVYILLYWAYVSNMDRRKTEKAIKYTFYSAILVSTWAIFEHFGKSFSCLIFKDFGSFDVSCWVQDVQNRVFATFGQPNWLAAWLTALIPLTWSLALISKINNVQDLTKSFSQKSKIIYIYFLSLLLFITLLFTKSRSGILGFVIAATFYWITILFKYHKNRKTITFKQNFFKSLAPSFLTINISILIAIIIFGTPWTPRLADIINKKPPTNIQAEKYQGPALETGGTESGQIRKIVWKGALDIWKDHPILGTGLETFAFSYYKYRPVEHNLVSEWNFLYNKAHNEYLNFAATTGTLGLMSYLILIIFSFFQILNPQRSILMKSQDSGTDNANSKYSTDQESKNYLTIALASGYISILITNFFGFSVVGVSLIFFLFPAMAVLYSEQKAENSNNKTIGKLNNQQVFLLAIIIFSSLFIFHSIYKYWYADYLYAKGKLENDSGLFNQSRNTLLKAIKYSSKESVFWDELAKATSSLAALHAENNDSETAQRIAQVALLESDKAIKLSPNSVILRKTRTRVFANLSQVDQKYMENAKLTLLEASRLAPSDAHISYNLAITHFRTGNMQEFLDTLKKTIEMKPNYKEARYAMAQYYIHENEIKSAIKELEYILEKIDHDESVEKELNQLRNKENQS